MSYKPRTDGLANVPAHIRARIRGPFHTREGQPYWTVHRLLPNGATGDQVGGPCFLWDQACERADDVANNRVVAYMGRVWKRHDIASQQSKGVVVPLEITDASDRSS